jgi:hypothetical protein
LIAGTENRVGRKIADGQSPMAKGREQ